VAKKTISSIDREDGQNLKGNQRDTSFETDKYGRRVETKQTTSKPDEVDKYGRKVKKEEPPTDIYKRDEPKKEEPQRD